MARFDRSDEIKGAFRTPQGRRDRTKVPPKGGGSLGTESAAAYKDDSLKGQSRAVYAALQGRDSDELTRKALAAMSKRGGSRKIKLEQLTQEEKDALGSAAFGDEAGNNRFEGLPLGDVKETLKWEGAEDLTGGPKQYRAPARSKEELLEAANLKAMNIAQDIYVERGALGQYKAALNIFKTKLQSNKAARNPAEAEDIAAKAAAIESEIAARSAKLDKLRARQAKIEEAIAKYEADPNDPANASMLDSLEYGDYTPEANVESVMEADPETGTMVTVKKLVEKPINAPEGDPDLAASRKKQAQSFVAAERTAGQGTPDDIEAMLKAHNASTPGTKNDLTLQKVGDVENVTKDSKAARKAKDDKVSDNRLKTIISAVCRNLPGM